MPIRYCGSPPFAASSVSKVRATSCGSSSESSASAACTLIHRCSESMAVRRTCTAFARRLSVCAAAGPAPAAQSATSSRESPACRVCILSRLVVPRAQQAVRGYAVDIIFQVLRALGGDRQPRIVAALDEPFLRQEPDRELEVLARPADQGLHVEDGHRWRPRFGTPPRIEQLEERQPGHLLLVIVDVGRLRDLRHLPALAHEV